MNILTRVALAALFSIPLFAHPFKLTKVQIELPQPQTFRIVMQCDLDALALGLGYDADDQACVDALTAMSTEEQAKVKDRLEQIFLRRVRLLQADERLEFSIVFAKGEESKEIPSFFGTEAILQGTLLTEDPVQFFASSTFPPVSLNLIRNSEIIQNILLEKGERSEPLPLSLWQKPPTLGKVWVQYLELGFTHILPKGLDHILFVLGLFLLSTAWRPLLAQVTAFTLAHSVTLITSTLGYTSLPSNVVEPLIALSIAYVAIENIFAKKMGKHRLFLVFGFGLLHGMGFAGVLGELGLPKQNFISALAAFNIGVEIGQVAVLGLAFLALGWWREKPYFKARVVIPISVCIAILGLYWTFSRL